MAKKWDIEVGGKKLQGEPVYPEIIWKDGLPVDEREAIENETMRIDSGLTSRKDSLVRLDGLDDEMAERKAKEIDDENKIDLPETKVTTDIPPKE